MVKAISDLLERQRIVNDQAEDADKKDQDRLKKLENERIAAENKLKEPEVKEDTKEDTKEPEVKEDTKEE